MFQRMLTEGHVAVKEGLLFVFNRVTCLSCLDRYRQQVLVVTVGSIESVLNTEW